jgi:(p)ppGpp synthase/HD superfamily hydrolase
LFENSKDIGIRVLAAGSLAERGNQNAMKFLEKCLYDSDPDVRLSVAYLLGGLRNPITINTMIEFLKNQEIATYFFEDETEKEPEGWKLEHRILGEIFHEYPDTVKNALLNAIGKGKLDEDNAIKVLTWANIRNAKAYLQYLLKKKDKTFSHISFLSSDDANKIPECCKSNLKIGDEAIAILNENNEKESIHAISCLSVKAAYWS